ncbi:MAG: Na+/H+ antiporter NhaA, partial [Gemmataceae bacterium]|nr:Na+/H+ antiporter NhaA [Gemmataceae bacterium]
LGDLAWAAREAVSPLERLEHGLHPAVSFLVMPIFALANAGVAIDLGRVTHPVALAVALGLVIGKPLGIFVMCRLAVRMGLARLPAGVSWKYLFAAGCLGGIGFTMAIFVAGLAFPEDQAPALLAAAKIGTLVGSVVSAIVGAGLIFWSAKDD